MSDYIDTRDGWTERDVEAPYPTHQARIVEYGEDNRVVRMWVREASVPPLPTEPFSTFRVHYADGEHILCHVLPPGALFTYASASGRPLDEVANGHGSILRVELLSEPRAVIAKALLDRVGEIWTGDMRIRDIAREFGVDQ